MNLKLFLQSLSYPSICTNMEQEVRVRVITPEDEGEI